MIIRTITLSLLLIFSITIELKAKILFADTLHHVVGPVSHQTGKFDIIDDAISKSMLLMSSENNGSFFPPETEFANFMIGIGSKNYSDKLKKAKLIVDKALESGKKISQLASGDLVSLPLVMEKMIGQTNVQIIFNSAKLYPKFAEIEVYIKIEMAQTDFEDKPIVLYFGATDIKFSSEKGLISGSVGLLSDYSIRLGDSEDAGLYLTKMEKELINAGDPLTPLDDEYRYKGTFVNFDCDGFKEMGVGGKIYFSREWLTPTDDFGHPLTTPNDSIKGQPNATPIVKGAFQIVVQDVSDWLIESLTITPFVLKKWDKMSFYIGNANLDFSSYRNPSGIPYPHVDAIGTEWEGVYIQSVAITMPEPFKRTCNSYGGGGIDTTSPPQTCRIKVSADHLLIDEVGVFGDFAIVGQAPLIGGPIMNGEWGWSLDSIGIKLIASNIEQFGFRGGLGVPILSKKGPLLYEAAYNPNTDTYLFQVEQEVQKEFPIWNVASANLKTVVATIVVSNGEFLPAVTLTGDLSIGNPADYSSSQTGSAVKMPGLSFVALKFQTVTPYVSFQSLTVNTGGNHVSGFPVTVTDPGLTMGGANPNDVKLSFNLNINLMSGGGGVSATGNLAIAGTYTRDENGTRKLKYKRFEFEGAQVVVSFPEFYARGTLKMFDDDPIYGKGFHAGVLAKVMGDSLATKPGKFNIEMVAVFGSTQGYRYWMVDGFVSGDAIHVPLPPTPLYLDGFGGGAFHHMKPASYNASASTSFGQSTSGIVYKPTQTTKLGLIFSTSLSSTSGLMSGLLTCIIRFGNNFNLQNITLWGTAEIMVSSLVSDTLILNITDRIPDNVKNMETMQKDDKAKINPAVNKILAKVGMSFDFENGFGFHAFAEVKLNLQNKITGSGTIDILAKPREKEWHFYLGGYYDGSVTTNDFFDPTMTIPLAPVSATLNYGGFTLSANAYFLTGNKIPGPPPPAPQVEKFFGAEASENNRGYLKCGPGSDPALGTGIAFGASCFFDFEKIKKGLFGSCVGGWKADLGGGIGFDLALLKYADGAMCSVSNQPSLGINGLRATGRVFAFVHVEAGHVTCIPLPHLGIGVKIRFDIIKPSYFQGIVVLDFIKKNVFKVNWGEECGSTCVPSIND